MLFTGIILTVARQLKAERSVSSIYYLLTGSRNIQSIQDAHIFSTGAFYGIYKGLDKHLFEQKIQELIDEGLLIGKNDEKGRLLVQITERAENLLLQNDCFCPLRYFNGITYEEVAPVFYERLLLVIQTFSNTREGSFDFIPVIHDRGVERYVRKLYRKVKVRVYEYLQVLYEELEMALCELPDDEVTIFVDRLSGFRHYGKSLAQLAADTNRDSSDVRLLLTGITHHLIHTAENDIEKYRIIYRLFSDLKKPVKVLGSTGKTYELLLQGLTPEEIASFRGLKLNTVYDHLAEIALHDSSFPFSSFVHEEAAKEILEAIDKTNSNKLKTIKENVREEISYFQIRLMLVFQHKFRKEGDKFA